MKQIILLLLLLQTVGNTNAQWVKRYFSKQEIQKTPSIGGEAISFSDSSHGFMAGYRSLLKYENNTWKPVPNFPDSIDNLHSIHSLDPQNTFLLEYDGDVIKYDGSAFTRVCRVSWNGPFYNSIHMLNPNDGWVVGQNGAVVHIVNNIPNYGGPVPSNFDSFADIEFDSPNHGWLIGQRYVNNIPRGVLYEYNNGNWTSHGFLDRNLIDIEFSSPGKGFILGLDAIYRYNSSTFQWLAEPIPNFRRQFRISVFTDNYAMTVSDSSSHLIYNNGTWSNMAASTSNLHGIACVGVGKAWAFSRDWHWQMPGNNSNLLHHFKNNAWQVYSLDYLDTIATVPYDEGFSYIGVYGKKNLWANGRHIKLPDAASWPDSTLDMDDNYVNAKHFYFSNFSLGTNGDLMEWKNNSWKIRLQAPEGDYYDEYFEAIHYFPDTTGFLIADHWYNAGGNYVDSEYVAYYNGTGVVNKFYTPLNNFLWSIHFSDKQHGWAVGDSGIVVKYSNGWTLSPRLANYSLSDVFTIDANTAWCVGDSGSLFKYNGTAWTKQYLPTNRTLWAIHFTSPNQGWIVGDSGLIFKYNGTSWIKDSSGTDEPLYSVNMVDSTYGYIGSGNDFILQYMGAGSNVLNIYDSVCNGANAHFSVPNALPGSSYQWQVDTGSGFQDISNGSGYSGVTTAHLTILNAQSSIVNNRYRCLYTAISANQSERIYAVRFKNVWTGAINNLWSNASNWSCGIIPDANTDVTINSGTVVVSSNITIRSLTLSPGVNFTVAPGVVVTILR